MGKPWELYQAPEPQADQDDFYSQYKTEAVDQQAPEKNDSFLGDSVDLLQRGASQAVGGALDFVGADDTAQNFYDIADQQLETLTPETREALDAELFSGEGDYYLGKDAGNARAWLAKGIETFGMMALPVPGGAVLSGVARVGLGLTKAAKAMAKAKGIPLKEAKQIIARDNKFKDWAATTAGYGGAEGAVSAGLTEKQVRDRILSMDQATLEAAEPYQAALQETGDPQAARQKVADTLSKEAAWKTFGPTALLGAGAGRFYDNALKGLGDSSRAVNAAKGGITEAAEEMPQSAAETLAANTTLQQVDPNIEATEGMAANVLEGGAFGFGTGAALGGVMPKGPLSRAAAKASPAAGGVDTGGPDVELPPFSNLNPDAGLTDPGQPAEQAGAEVPAVTDQGGPIDLEQLQSLRAEIRARYYEMTPEQQAQAQTTLEQIAQLEARANSPEYRNQQAINAEFDEQPVTITPQAPIKNRMPEQKAGTPPDPSQPVVRSDGTPFGSEEVAAKALKNRQMSKTHQVVAIDGGFGLVRLPEQEVRALPSPKDMGHAPVTSSGPIEGRVGGPGLDQPAKTLMRSDGSPFVSEAVAQRAAKARGLTKTHAPVPVEGGYGLAEINEYFGSQTSAEANNAIENDRIMRSKDAIEHMESMSRGLVKGGAIALVPRPGARPKNRGQLTGDILEDYDASDLVRTPSLNPDWFQSLSSDLGVSVADVGKAIAAHKAGKKLGKRQQQIIEAMSADYRDRLDEADADEWYSKRLSEPDKFDPVEYNQDWENGARTIHELISEAMDINDAATESAISRNQNEPDRVLVKQLREIINGNHARTAVGNAAPGQGTQEKRNEAKAKSEPAAARKETDLLGDNTATAQSIADKAREKDARRNPAGEQPALVQGGDELFANGGKLEPDLFATDSVAQSGIESTSNNVQDSPVAKQQEAVAPEESTPSDRPSAETVTATSEEARPETIVKETEETLTKPEGKEKEAADEAQGPIEAYGDETLDLRRMQDKTPSLQKDLSEDDIASMPLSKIWPKKEVDAIEDDGVAAFATAARSEIPNKPRKGYKLKRWVEQVKTLRGLTSRYMEDPEGVRKRMMETPALRDFAQKVDLLTQIGREHWSRVEGVAAYPDAYRYGENDERIPSPHVSVIIDGKRQRIDGVKSVNEGIDQIRQLLQDTTPDKSVNMKFTVRGREGSYFIHKEGDPEYRKLATFTSSAEALRYRREHPDKLADEWAKVKARDNVKKADVRSKENRPRTGADHRQGKDVTVEQFHEEFGLRHVDWGQWVKDDGSRKTTLNEAFDAFADLADIVGIPRKAIGLNGDLIITFGKRGHGWASAHFEAGGQIINMTKTRGAGSLGHEWFHALDNYFQRQRGEPKGPNREDHFVTYRPERLFVHKDYPNHPGLTKAKLEERRKSNPNSGYFSEGNWIPDPNHPEGVRPEVEARFAELVNVLDESPMTGRVSKIDKGKSDGYWSRILERAARSFENYVIVKMQKDGYHNDYLANVTSIDEFSRDPGRYPYLLESEMEPVEAAFDNLFGEIETRETESGVTMFSRSSDHRSGQRLPHELEARGQGLNPEDNTTTVFSRSGVTKKAYETRIDELFSGKAGRRAGVKVLDSSDVLGMLGLGDKPVYLTESKVIAGQENHGLTADHWKKIPEWLDNPVAVFDSDTVSGRLVAIAPETVNGAPVVMVLQPNAGGTDIHILVNAYNKDRGRAPFERWANDGLMRYIDEKQSRVLRGTSGLQISRVTTHLKHGSNGKIYRKRDLVKYREENQGKFSREKPSKPEYAIFGMPVDEIESTIAPITRAWTNAPDVVVAENMDDPRIPAAVRADNRRQMSQGATGDVEGFIHNGTVYLVAENLKSPLAAVRVLFHEALGHAGLRVFGKRVHKILDQIADVRRAEVAAKAKEYGLDMTSLQDRRTAAEEVLAEMAQTRPEIGFVRRAVAAIRDWLRQHVPAFRNMKLSDAEIIRQYILPARRFVESGTSTGKQGASASFSRKGKYGSDRASWSGFPSVVAQAELGAAKKHADYAAAKAGNLSAAVNVVRDLMRDGRLNKVRTMIGDKKPIIVPVQAEESSGRNKLPLAYALELGNRLGLEVDGNILQTVRASHTDSGAFHRIAMQPVFDGDIQPGQSYLIVDDTMTMGGTLANLRGHIEANGGEVLGASVLTAFPGAEKIAITETMEQRIAAKHGDKLNDYLNENFGFGIESLTQGEAGHLRKAVSLDAIRDRIDAARSEAGYSILPDTSGENVAHETEAGNENNQRKADNSVRRENRIGADAGGPEVQGSFSRRAQSEGQGGNEGDGRASIPGTGRAENRQLADNPSFRDWFGDSKVVDAEGNPRILYRGESDPNYTVFDKAKQGSSTPSAGSGYGHFFGPSRRIAEGYGDTVREFYLSIQNPFVMLDEDFREVRTIEEARAIAAWVESQGYDGIYVPEDDTYIAFNSDQIKLTDNDTFTKGEPDIRYSRSAVANGEVASQEAGERASIWEAINNRLDPIRYQMQDKLIDLKRKQQEIERDPDASPITDASNPYQKAAIWEGRAGERLNAFDEEHVQPLLEQIAKTGKSITEVGEWLVARHAEEANAYLAEINPDKPDNERYRMSGMSNEEAQAILDANQGNAALQEVGEMIDTINRQRVDDLIAEGLITQDDADAWQGRYQHYVPLKREEAEETHSLPGRGQGFQIKGKESKRRTGAAYLDAANVVANTLAQYENTVVRTEKNRVGKALLELAESNPDESFWEVVTERKQTVVRNGKVQEQVRVQDRDNELTVKRDGTEHTIIFNPANKKAVRLANAMKNLSVAEMNSVFKVMAKINRFLSSINTTYNPEFVISNFARDIQTAGYNLTDTELSGIEMRVLKSVPKALNGIRSALFGKGDAEWAPIWEDFKKQGGKTGWIDLHSDVKVAEHNLQKSVDRLREGKPTKTKIRQMLDAVDSANTVVENGVRLAAYKHAIDAGLTKEKAAALAKDLTVNFNRKGMAGPVMNSLYMFYNASAQGSVRLMQAMIHSSKGRKLAVATVGFAFALDMINRSLAGDDDDGENLYDALPDYIKNHNLIIMGEKEPLIKIPLPWGYNVLHAVGQSIGEAATSDRFSLLDAGARVAGAAADAFNPVGSSTIAQTLAPTLADPIIQIAENKNFAGIPLKPEHTYDSRVPRPEYQMHWSSVSDESKSMAKMLNDLTGGNEVRPGFINWSPEHIDMLVSQATGGAGRFFLGVAGMTNDVISGRDTKTSDIPFVRKVTGYDSESGVKMRYYEWSKGVGYSKKALKDLKGPDLMAERRRPESKLVPIYNATEKRLRNLRKMRRSLVAANANEKRIEAIDQKIRENMSRFNKAYAEQVLQR